MSNRRTRAARAIMAETGWNYTRALREADRRHALAATAVAAGDAEATMAVAGFRAGGEPFRTVIAAQPARPGETLTVDGGRHMIVAVGEDGTVHVGRAQDPA